MFQLLFFANNFAFVEQTFRITREKVKKIEEQEKNFRFSQFKFRLESRSFMGVKRSYPLIF